MNYIESDNKELQEVWEQLTRAVTDLQSSGNLTQFEQEEKSKLVRRLNRRYDVLNNRAQYNRTLGIKVAQVNETKKILKGISIAVAIGLLWYILLVLLIK